MVFLSSTITFLGITVILYARYLLATGHRIFIACCKPLVPPTGPLEAKVLTFVKGSSIVYFCTGTMNAPLNIGTPKQKMEHKSCRAQEEKNQENQHLFKNDLQQILSKISTDYDNIIVEFAFFEKPVVRASRKV